MNILNMEIVRGCLRSGSVVLRSGLSMQDGPAAAGIRPESFRYDPEGFEVTVQSTSVVRRDRNVTFRLNGQQVCALLDPDQIVSPGDTLHLSVRKGHIFLFDPVTQDVIVQL